MPDRSTVLIVADDETDCRALVGVLSHQPAYEVVGPLAALEALRFCARAIPAVVLVHVWNCETSPPPNCVGLCLSEHKHTYVRLADMYASSS